MVLHDGLPLQANTLNNNCAGKGYSNSGIILLKVKFIDKTGLFCYTYVNNLLQEILGLNGKIQYVVVPVNCDKRGINATISKVDR